jgi:hypothetical protein
MINFPKIHCPIPSAVNPYAEIVDKHTLAWARRFNLLPNENDFEHLKKSKFGWLVARAYPNAPLEELKIVTDWNTWLFIRDDECDESGLGKNPTLLSAVQSDMLEILNGREPTQYDSPLAHALYDIRNRLLQKVSPAWMGRFIYSIIEYFDSCEWEARNRADGIIPDTAAYILMRPYTGALFTVIELISLTEKVYLPLHVRNNDVLRRLEIMSINVVCWSNDIISFAKESKHHDVHNLVATLLSSQHLSLQKAISLATDMTNAEISAFIELEKQLPSFTTEIDAELQRYIAVLRSWMRGNLDWSYESGRYAIEISDCVMES